MSGRPNILWIWPGSSPEEALATSLAEFLAKPAELPEALALLAAEPPDAVVAGFPIEGWTPAELLEVIQRSAPGVPVLVRDPEGTMPDAVRLARLGAWQVFGHTVDPGEFARQLEAAVEERRLRDLAQLGAGVAPEPWRKLLVGESRPMQAIAEIIRLVGARRSTVLITGETGTGKEMVARAIHMAGPRRHKPLVIVNCSALPEHLLEAELFGHVKGAFTGAISHRTGRIELADGGTLFLDEIGDMPMELQPKLLRVLQEREFQRLGSSETVRVDIRVIAASNANLLERVRQGRFREDLYYRLNVVPIETPPLRERGGDIPLLVEHFVREICGQENLAVKQVHRETMDRLCRYRWPGNVRQVENAVEMAVVLSGDRQVLYPGDFPLPSPSWDKTKPVAAVPLIRVPDHGLDFERTVGEFERNILAQALEKTGGNKRKAADLLRLKRTTLTAKLRTLESRAGVEGSP